MLTGVISHRPILVHSVFGDGYQLFIAALNRDNLVRLYVWTILDLTTEGLVERMAASNLSNLALLDKLMPASSV